jgi:hypothetical protein
MNHKIKIKLIEKFIISLLIYEIILFILTFFKFNLIIKTIIEFLALYLFYLISLSLLYYVNLIFKAMKNE